MLTVSVIIVTWNSSQYLDKCLSALKVQVFQDFELIVVDNDSRDDSIEKIRRYFPAAKVIENKKNVGFAPANNQGMFVSSCEYIFLLNTDCFLTPNYLQGLVFFLDGNEEVAGVQGKLLSDGNNSRVDSLGIDIKMTGVAKDISQGQKDRQNTRVSSVEALCAAAVMYRKSSLDEVKDCNGNIFDPDFISYYEDVDLGVRLKNADFKLFCLPKSVAYHVRGGSQVDLAKMHRLALRNKYFVIVKNWSAAKILLQLPFVLGWEVIKFFKFLFTQPTVLPGYLDVIKDFKLFLSKRNA